MDLEIAKTDDFTCIHADKRQSLVDFFFELIARPGFGHNRKPMLELEQQCGCTIIYESPQELPVEDTSCEHSNKFITYGM